MNAYILYIQLNDKEWGNELMDAVAKDAIDSRPDMDWLVVEVREHAGWYMAYAKINGKVQVVGSANSEGQKSPEVKDWIRQYNERKQVYLGSVHRGHSPAKHPFETTVHIP